MLSPVALLGLVTIQVIQNEHLENTSNVGHGTVLVEPETATAHSSAVEQRTAEVQAKVVAHCEVALGRGECGPATTAKDASALVVFETNRVLVTLLSEPNGEPRSLEFSPTDTPEQRQVAAGLLVAAMSAAAESEREAALRIEQEEKARAKADESRKIQELKRNKAEAVPPPAPGDPHPTQLMFDLGMSVTPPLDTSSTQLGALLRTTWQLSRLSGVFIDFRFSQSLQDGPRLRFGDAALGTTLALTPTHSPVLAWFSGSAVLNVVEVSQVTNIAESRLAIRGGARLGLGVAPRIGSVSPWLGVDVVGLAPTVEIRVGDQLVQQLPAFALMASLGIRLSVNP